MNTQIRSRFALVAAVLISSAWAGSSQAALVLMGQGSASGSNPVSPNNTVSAAVYFYYDTADTKTLIIDLVNTTPKTLQPADALTGLTFDIAGNPAYALVSKPDEHNLTPSLTLTGLGVTSTSLGSGTSWTESWTNWRDTTKNTKIVGAYGISTTGFSGAFHGNGLGSEDNSIVGANTVTGGGFNTNHQPLAVTGLEFKLTFTTDVTNFKFSNGQFLFGSNGNGYLNVNVNPSVPEPSSIAAFGIGIVGMALMRRIRKSA